MTYEQILAFGLICSAWFMLLIVPFAFIPALILRLRLEEPALVGKLPDDAPAAETQDGAAERTRQRIAVARRDFILAVQKYNTEIRTFPGRLWHSVMYSDLPIRETFEATTPGAEKAPEVKF